MATLPVDYEDASTPTGAKTELPATTTRGLNAITAQINSNTSDLAAPTNKTLTNSTFTNYTESVVPIGNTGASQTLNLTSGTVQTATLTASCTFTMPTATTGKSFTLLLKTGAGSFTAIFTGVKWPLATAPTITVTAARLDIFTFVADGTNWYGSFAQNYTP